VTSTGGPALIPASTGYERAVSIDHGDTMLRNQLFEDLDQLPPVQRLAVVCHSILPLFYQVLPAIPLHPNNLDSAGFSAENID
jgi:hypothetical protein